MVSLSVIIPTLNEGLNIKSLILEVEKVLDGWDYEIIVVDDDSSDGTADLVKAYFCNNNRVFCINRSWDKGLSSAVMVGFALSSKDYICVMDGDGQHNPIDLVAMAKDITDKGLNLVVGSRVLDQSLTAMSPMRKKISRLGIMLTNLFISEPITDPLSGFFLVKKDVLIKHRKKLYKPGFKILFDILMLDKTLKVGQVKISFNERIAGNSKMTASTFFHVIGQIVQNITRGILPSRFIVFAIMGLSGLMIQLAVLYSLIYFNGEFLWSNTIAILFALANNYLLNNFITFSNAHRTMKAKIKGFIKYVISNSLSLIGNIGVAGYLYSDNFGVTIAALAGVMSGIFLNYFMSKEFTFR